MNKRIRKKKTKITKNELKSLHLVKGDTIIVKVDMDEYDPSEMYDLFSVLSPIAKAKGCDCWLIPKPLDVEKLDERRVKQLEKIVEEWYTLHDEIDYDKFEGGY